MSGTTSLTPDVFITGADAREAGVFGATPLAIRPVERARRESILEKIPRSKIYTRKVRGMYNYADGTKRERERVLSLCEEAGREERPSYGLLSHGSC